MRHPAVYWTVVFLACLAAQSAVVPVVSVYGALPDLVLLALFVFALRYGVLPAAWAGFALGLCQDLYAPAVLGQHALAMTLAGAAAGVFNVRVMNLAPLVRLLLLLAVVVGHDLVAGAVDVARHAQSSGALLGALLARTLPRAVYTVFLGALQQLWERYRAPARLG